MGSDWSLATRKPVSFRKSFLIALAMGPPCSSFLSSGSGTSRAIATTRRLEALDLSVGSDL